MRNALVVLSGGQDSTTCLFWAIRRSGRNMSAIGDYGQRHKAELACAEQICADSGVPFEIMETPSSAN